MSGANLLCGRANLFARVILGLLLLAGCAKPGGAPSPTQIAIVGAGATFDYPFFSKAFFAYLQRHPDVTVNYQSIGSGGGIQQFTKKTVDFGATDVPMNANELAAVTGGPGAVVQLPITLGGVAIAYNVPGAPEHLRLSAKVLSDIFLGQISNWDDKAIAALNPGLSLGSLPIIVVHRADGSGTTYLFTAYLSAVSPQWKQTSGVGKTVNWTAGSAVGAKGNEGVAGQIRNTAGAIGYVELAYALQTGMKFAALQNKSGSFVVPSIDSVRAAAAQKPSVTAKDFLILDEVGNTTYPIAGYSWILLYRRYPDGTKQKALNALFRWLLTDGQALATSIDYVPLPPSVSRAGIRALQRQTIP